MLLLNDPSWLSLGSFPEPGKKFFGPYGPYYYLPGPGTGITQGNTCEYVLHNTYQVYEYSQYIFLFSFYSSVVATSARLHHAPCTIHGVRVKGGKLLLIRNIIIHIIIYHNIYVGRGIYVHTRTYDT